MSDDRKQDAATTTAHIKHIIGLLKQRNILSSKLSKIWENIYGFAEHYRCSTALYLMSMLSQAFFVIIHRGISATGYDRGLVDVRNNIDKMFLLQLISNVKLLGEKVHDTQIVMHTGTRSCDVTLARKTIK